MRSARATTTSDTSTPARAIASAAPSSWSERGSASVTASPFWVRRAPQKFTTMAAVESAAEAGRLRVGEGHRWHDRPPARRAGGGATVDRGLHPLAEVTECAPGRHPRLEADEPAEERHVDVGARPRGGAACASRRRTGCAAADTVEPSNGTRRERPVELRPVGRRRSSSTSRSASRASTGSTFAGGASIVIGTTHRTCGMLRRTRHEEMPDAHAESRRPRPRVHPDRPARQEGEALRLQGQEGGRLLLPEGRHARVHHRSRARCATPSPT